MSIDTQALIAKIKKQTESFDTVVLKEDEANALVEAMEAAEKRIAELIHIISMHTVELGFGEKPITMAELIIAREGSGSDVLAAILAAGITVKGDSE